MDDVGDTSDHCKPGVVSNVVSLLMHRSGDPHGLHIDGEGVVKAGRRILLGRMRRVPEELLGTNDWSIVDARRPNLPLVSLRSV